MEFRFVCDFVCTCFFFFFIFFPISLLLVSPHPFFHFSSFSPYLGALPSWTLFISWFCSNPNPYASSSSLKSMGLSLWLNAVLFSLSSSNQHSLGGSDLPWSVGSNQWLWSSSLMGLVVGWRVGLLLEWVCFGVLDGMVEAMFLLFLFGCGFVDCWLLGLFNFLDILSMIVLI